MEAYRPANQSRREGSAQKISFSCGVCLALMFATAQPAWPKDATSAQTPADRCTIPAVGQNQFLTVLR